MNMRDFTGYQVWAGENHFDMIRDSDLALVASGTFTEIVDNWSDFMDEEILEYVKFAVSLIKDEGKWTGEYMAVA